MKRLFEFIFGMYFTYLYRHGKLDAFEDQLKWAGFVCMKSTPAVRTYQLLHGDRVIEFDIRYVE